MNKPVLIGLICLGVFLLFSLMRFISRKRREKREKEMMAGDRLREEALDSLLVNERARRSKMETFSAKPVEVSYNANTSDPESGGRKGKKGGSKKMLQILEISEVSERKYMLNPQKGIRIGSKNGKNNIVLTDSGVDDIQCEIMLFDGEIYTRNVGQRGSVVLYRGRQQAQVRQKAIPIRTGDVLQLGRTRLKLEIV
ncbi:MAG: FHA domain-containing protein [Lachnospiraceae bacterium]|nr:FHA domain-containing protein [Lachnospiraceae bacterium]